VKRLGGIRACLGLPQVLWAKILRFEVGRVAAAVPSSRDLIQRGEAGNPADETPVAKV